MAHARHRRSRHRGASPAWLKGDPTQGGRRSRPEHGPRFAAAAQRTARPRRPRPRAARGFGRDWNGPAANHRPGKGGDRRAPRRRSATVDLELPRGVARLLPLEGVSVAGPRLAFLTQLAHERHDIALGDARRPFPIQGIPAAGHDDVNESRGVLHGQPDPHQHVFRPSPGNPDLRVPDRVALPESGSVSHPWCKLYQPRALSSPV